MDRRSLLGSILLAVVVQPRGWSRWISTAWAVDRNWRHGVSLFDDLKYPVEFGHFEYVNPDSPKGGTAQQIALGTFDNFNSVVAGVKGSLAAGVDLIYETLHREVTFTIDAPGNRELPLIIGELTVLP